MLPRGKEDACQWSNIEGAVPIVPPVIFGGSDALVIGNIPPWASRRFDFIVQRSCDEALLKV